MAAIVAKGPRSTKSWRVPRLPSIPVSLCSESFFQPGPRNRNCQLCDAWPTTRTTPPTTGRKPAAPRPIFTARMLPIKTLKEPVCPHETGPNLLRTFLYARSKWPDQPFRNCAARASEAVHESNRIDGLPRVVFAVGKGVQALLRGKLHSVIRSKFKRRAKTAFKCALEDLRREDESTFPQIFGATWTSALCWVRTPFACPSPNWWRR
jgi:hypothetical protein